MTDKREGHDAWSKHSYTRGAQKRFAERKDQLKLELLAALGKTTDPAVAATWARFQEARAVCKFFQPKEDAKLEQEDLDE